MTGNEFVTIGFWLPAFLTGVFSVVYYIVGLFVLVRLDEAAIEALHQSALPSNMLGGIVAWTIWPVLLIIYSYRIANARHSKERRW